MKRSIAFFLCLFFTAVQAAPNPAETEAALDKINASFRKQYALARAENLASLPLIIVVDTPAVTWVSHGKRRQMAVPQVLYTETKVLLHAILGAYGVGSRIVRNGGTEAEWKDARELRANINAAIKLASRSSVGAGDRARLQGILASLRDEVSQWIAAGSLNQEQLEESLRPVRKDSMILANERAMEHFKNLRNCLAAIRKSVPADEWERAIVVVPGSPAARHDNVGVAAAIAEVGRGALGRRIFYAENIFDADGAIQFAAGLLIDRGLAETFFDNPYRMWRDLLGDEVRNKVGGDFYPGLAR